MNSDFLLGDSYRLTIGQALKQEEEALKASPFCAQFLQGMKGGDPSSITNVKGYERWRQRYLKAQKLRQLIEMHGPDMLIDERNTMGLAKLMGIQTPTCDKIATKRTSLVIPCMLKWWQDIDKQVKGYVVDDTFYPFPEWPWHIGATSSNIPRLKALLEGCRIVKGVAGLGEQTVEIAEEWLIAQEGVFPVRPSVAPQTAVDAWHRFCFLFQLNLDLAVGNKRLAREKGLDHVYEAWTRQHQDLITGSGWLFVFSGGGARLDEATGLITPTPALEAVFPDWRERCDAILILFERLYARKPSPPCLSLSPMSP